MLTGCGECVKLLKTSENKIMTIHENLTGIDGNVQRQETRKLLREKLAAGMTRDELNDLKSELVTFNNTVEEHIELSLDLEVLERRKVDGEDVLIKKSPKKSINFS